MLPDCHPVRRDHEWRQACGVCMTRRCDRAVSLPWSLQAVACRVRRPPLTLRRRLGWEMSASSCISSGRKCLCATLLAWLPPVEHLQGKTAHRASLLQRDHSPAQSASEARFIAPAPPPADASPMRPRSHEWRHNQNVASAPHEQDAARWFAVPRCGGWASQTRVAEARRPASAPIFARPTTGRLSLTSLYADAPENKSRE
jgi:hypothetical protein